MIFKALFRPAIGRGQERRRRVGWSDLPSGCAVRCGRRAAARARADAATCVTLTLHSGSLNTQYTPTIVSRLAPRPKYPLPGAPPRYLPRRRCSVDGPIRRQQTQSALETPRTRAFEAGTARGGQRTSKGERPPESAGAGRASSGETERTERVRRTSASAFMVQRSSVEISYHVM